MAVMPREPRAPIAIGFIEVQHSNLWNRMSKLWYPFTIGPITAAGTLHTTLDT